MMITSNIIMAMMKDREAVHITKLLMIVMDFVMATMIIRTIRAVHLNIAMSIDNQHHQ